MALELLQHLGRAVLVLELCPGLCGHWDGLVPMEWLQHLHALAAGAPLGSQQEMPKPPGMVRLLSPCAEQFGEDLMLHQNKTVHCRRRHSLQWGEKSSIVWVQPRACRTDSCSVPRAVFASFS